MNWKGGVTGSPIKIPMYQHRCATSKRCLTDKFIGGDAPGTCLQIPGDSVGAGMGWWRLILTAGLPVKKGEERPERNYMQPSSCRRLLRSPALTPPALQRMSDSCVTSCNAFLTASALKSSFSFRNAPHAMPQVSSPWGK